jgi:sterol 3beta-glucosyltransferase
MRIGLQTWGSDGDILPFMALAKGLADAGHTVTVAYTSVDDKDYCAHGSQGGFRTIKACDGLRTGADLYALTPFTDPFSELRALLQTCYEPAVAAMFAASEALCKEHDVVIGHTLCHTLLTASEKHHCPRVSLCLAPMVIRTDSMPPVGPNLGRFVSSTMWAIGDLAMTTVLFPKAKALRREQGLPPIRSLQQELFTSRQLTLVAASPVLCPRPADWGPHIQMSGFLNIPQEEGDTLSEDLRAFLAAGPSPVYMTFGTCMQFAMQQNMRLFVDAAKLSGQRAIIQGDGGVLGLESSVDVLFVGRMPHAKVFPHCAAVVHHGGAGTTQAALLAGCPSVVVAHAYDQHDWAKRLHRAGVGARPLFRRTIRPQALAAAISSSVSDLAMKKRADQLGEKMSKENGVQQAVALIEAHLGLHTAG